MAPVTLYCEHQMKLLASLSIGWEFTELRNSSVIIGLERERGAWRICIGIHLLNEC